MAEICVYMTSVSSRLQISKQQRAILDFLDARGIEYRPVDMCANLKARGQMLEKLPEDSKPEGKQILPPQVFNGEDYCGDYEQFFDARECDLIYSFFKLNPPEGSSEWLAANPPKEEEPEEVAEEMEEVEEEEEENIDHEGELKDSQPANEDTPMDAEGGEEKMELFAALKKESGEGVPDVALVEENNEDEPAASEAEVEAAEAEEEKEEEVEYVEEQPAEDTAEVEEYNSDAE